MTIIRRLAKGYAAMSLISLGMLGWLGWHEFVEEPEEYAAMGMPELHKDTDAEIGTVLFLGFMPVLLGCGWWWTRKSLSPLSHLANAVDSIDTHNLLQPLPQGSRGDEVERLSTAFSQMATRLDESIRQIHEFTLHASHELKTPLTIMRANLETVLRESSHLPLDQSKWIDDQIDEVKRLTRIVDSLTLLTKADAGLVELENAPVALDVLIEEAYEDALVLAQPHGLEVEMQADRPVSVLGDRHRLRQLLLILTDNAVKYNKPGGRVDLSLAVRGDVAEICVENTGPGIKPESVARVFDRFARAESGRGEVDGCGLGLNIAHWIVQAHGGQISFESGIDTETIVEVRLPLAPASSTTVSASPSRSPAWEI